MRLQYDTKGPPLEVYSVVIHSHITITKLPLGTDGEKYIKLILGFVTPDVRLEQVAVAW